MMQHSTFNRTVRRIGVLLGAFALISVPVLGDGFGQDETPAAAEKALDLTGVEVDDFDTFNIQVQDTDLAQVLQMLALQGERNVIASRNVSAVITANLFDVTFEEALDAILKPNGFRWVEEGKFIYVYTQEEFARMEALDRKTESRMFELEHISARDASEFATPLLSERGKLSFIGEVAGGIERDLGDMGGDNWAKSAILVVNDYADRLERISELLSEIDTAPRQVVVDATIASVQVTENDAFGVDFSIMGNLDITKLVSPLGPVTDLLRGTVPPKEGGNGGTPLYNGNSTSWGTQSTPGNTNSGQSNFKVGLVAGDASVFVRALDLVTDTMVLARPRIMALNRQRAQVMVGKRVAYLSTTSTDTTTTQTVQYLDTGVKLMLRPFISKDDTIRMELYPSVSSAELRTIAAGFAEGLVQVPDEFTNEISTNVKVRDGQTLVLGGLFQEQTTVTNSQVPFLGDIPILGTAFSGHDNEVRRREIIFMITPKIVADDLIAESGRQGIEFVKSLRAGMREGLLPFSREKMSSQQNQSAFEAMNSGNSELAIFHFDNSLRLNPGQPEVRRLRASTAGEADGGYYDYDMWRRVMEDQHADHAELKDDEARLNSEFDPLAAVNVDIDTDTGTRSEEREDRFLDALVSDLERDEEAMVFDANISEANASGTEIFLVEADPMSVGQAFGSATTEDSKKEFTAIADSEESETAAAIADAEFTIPVAIADAESTVNVASAEMMVPESATQFSTEAAPETVEATTAAIRAKLPAKSPAAAAMLATAATTSVPTTLAKPMLAVQGRVAPIERDEAVEEFTTDDALEVVAEAQRVLVSAPRSPVWGRLWWLARIASEQARAFSKETTPAIEMVTAEERD
jgi:type IV pilus assembly protein PilQ